LRSIIDDDKKRRENDNCEIEALKRFSGCEIHEEDELIKSCSPCVENNKALLEALSESDYKREIEDEPQWFSSDEEEIDDEESSIVLRYVETGVVRDVLRHILEKEYGIKPLVEK